MKRFISAIFLFIIIVPASFAQRNENKYYDYDMGDPKGFIMYTAALPDEYLGFSLGRINRAGRFGGQVEMRMNFNPPEKDIYGISQRLPDLYGDEVRGERVKSVSFGGGINYRVSNDITFYSNLIMNKTTVYDRRYDATHIFGTNGIYYIETSKGKLKAGIDAGCLFTYTQPSRNMIFHLGACSAPLGAHVGIGWTFKFRTFR